jgi:hypothetical protein
MIGECTICGEECVYCKASSKNKLEPFSRHQENDPKERYRQLNTKIIPLGDYLDPPYNFFHIDGAMR